jgi:hypothetical protein
VKREKSSDKKKALLLGLGLDNKDGHVRITKGENFALFGGSRETHEEMQEKAVKFNEELKARGKRLEDIGREEFYEIAEKTKMGIPFPPRPGCAR